jgi:hypothetical protein
MAGTTYDSGAVIGQPRRRFRGQPTSHTSLTGLEYAANPNDPSNQEGPGADPINDPNGTALLARAEADRKAYEMLHPVPFSGGVAPLNNGMTGFLQALKEKGVSKLGAGASPEGSNQLTGSPILNRARQPGQDRLTTYGNPAGMTQEAAITAAQNSAQSGELPGWYGSATAPTQQMFQRRVRQSGGSAALRGLKGLL